jgi:hypothetical protein
VGFTSGNFRYPTLAAWRPTDLSVHCPFGRRSCLPDDPVTGVFLQWGYPESIYFYGFSHPKNHPAIGDAPWTHDYGNLHMVSYEIRYGSLPSNLSIGPLNNPTETSLFIGSRDWPRVYLDYSGELPQLPFPTGILLLDMLQTYGYGPKLGLQNEPVYSSNDPQTHLSSWGLSL